MTVLDLSISGTGYRYKYFLSLGCILAPFIAITARTSIKENEFKTTLAMENFDQIVMEFNSLIKSYNFLEALHKFYHPDVISGDNTNPSITGLRDLIKETEHFVENAQIEFIVLRSITVEKNLTVSNWHYKFMHKTFGLIDTNQISVQRWRDGKIFQEHHFYIS